MSKPGLKIDTGSAGGSSKFARPSFDADSDAFAEFAFKPKKGAGKKKAGTEKKTKHVRRNSDPPETPTAKERKASFAKPPGAADDVYSKMGMFSLGEEKMESEPLSPMGAASKGAEGSGKKAKRKISQALVELNAKTTIVEDLHIGDVWGTVSPTKRKITTDGGLASPRASTRVADLITLDEEVGGGDDDSGDERKSNFTGLLVADDVEERALRIGGARRRSSLPEPKIGALKKRDDKDVLRIEKRHHEDAVDGVLEDLEKMDAKGIGLPENIRKLMVEAGLGWTESQFTLGYCFDTGSGGVKPDTEKAIQWYTEAASSGHVTAQNNLGVLLATGHRGRIKANHADAFEWYRRAAEAGHPNAEFHVGLAYLKGDGVEKKDEAMAFRWFKRAAKQGHVLAEANVGAMYMSGQGIEIDFKKALKWSKRAAMQGSAIAHHNLAVMYMKGYGTPIDESKATRHLEEAMSGINSGTISKKMSDETMKAGNTLMNM